jgi:pyrimidine deaminase RibD-like protein
LAVNATPLQLTLMRRALSESYRALPACRPNPPVGCVLARGDVVIATGHTNPPGQHHAEAMALAQLTPQDVLQPFEVYVTLEPCSFFGRTPSCALALIKYPVSCVYVAMLDPHERNNGKGIDILRNANIPVVVGILEQEVRAFLEPYVIRS